jgi:hypothetical protein
MASELKVDTISEKTTASGVTIDGVKLKDSAVEVDTISESTVGSGVTIDGVTLKDSIVEVDTINESTASSGVTIDGVLLQDGNVDGVDVSALNTTVSGLTSNPAYTIVDTFAQNADKSGASVLNNIVNEPEGYGGTVSQSGGVFTFPETGYWLIEAWFNWTRPQNTDLNSKIQITTNGSSYSTATNNQHGTGSSVESQTTVYTNYIFDVTNTSTHKVRFYVDGTFNTYSRLRANGTKEETWFRFSKLQDT